MTLRDQIAQQALALPSEDRQFLADLLEQSLPSPTPQLVAAWRADIDRRVGAYLRGDSQAVDRRTAMEEMRRRIPGKS